LIEYDQLTNKFNEPVNKVLEVFISLIAITFGAIAFFIIMTPIESSILYELGSFLRFGIFVFTLFLIISFIVNPLFKMLKVEK